MSSKRRQRRLSCGRKVRHLTSAAAAIARARLHEAQGYQGELNIYLCRFCNGYHLGHRGAKGRK